MSLSPQGELTLEAVLRPLRPLQARAELVVRPPRSSSGGSGSGGGAWRFPVRIVFSPPQQEGTLVIESDALGAPATATLHLANAFPRRARFVATLSHDTPTEFRVAPGIGVLPASTAAAIARGTGLNEATAAAISVTFTPSEYGRAWGGRLVVDTPHYQWVWKLVGRLRDAAPPVAPQSSIDDHLDASARGALKAAHTATTRRAERKKAGGGGP